MPNTDRTPGLRGRRPAVFPDGLQVLGAYLTQPLPAPVLPIDVSGGFGGWEMLGNGPDPTLTVNGGNPVGDCGFAGMVHKRMADGAFGGAGEQTFTADEVVTAYLAYDGGQDQGVVVSDMMRAWFGSGFFGSKIEGYAPVQLGQVDAALAVFGAVIFGVNLTPDADQLFQNGQPWNVDQGQTPDPNEGHVIVKVKSDPEFDTFVTWGAEQKATKGWTAACAEEAWVPITAEMARRWKVALAALARDITALGGQQDVPVAPPAPTPVPVPPAPPAPPAPVPTPPGPGPAPAPGVVAEIEHDAEVAAAAVERVAEDAIHALEGKAEAPPDAG